MLDGSGICSGRGLSGVSVFPRKCGASGGGLEVIDAEGAKKNTRKMSRRDRRRKCWAFLKFRNVPSSRER